MRNLFTQPDAWSGGFFELTFKLPQETKSLANVILANFWTVSSLNGCYLKRDIEPEQQEKYSPTEFEHRGHWYGIANFPNGKQSCCGSFWMDYENDECWITFYIPIGSLSNAYDIGSYPYNLGTQGVSNWMTEINDWLVDIARQIYPLAKFKLGIIGFEVDFFKIEKQLMKGIPDKRWDGLLVPSENQLLWFPPTIHVPPYTIERRLR
jgi:hypothetical protein